LSCNSVSEGGFADSDSRSSFKTGEVGEGRTGGGRGEAEKASTSGLGIKDEGDIKQAKKEVRSYLRAVAFNLVTVNTVSPQVWFFVLFCF
jgi:hypothetical protein